MIKKDLLNPSERMLKYIFKKEFPRLVLMASQHKDFSLFKEEMRAMIVTFKNNHLYAGESQQKAFKQILLLLDYEGKEIDELSTGESMKIHSLFYLWQFLRSTFDAENGLDVIFDWYYQLKEIHDPIKIIKNERYVKSQMRCWPSGLGMSMKSFRAKNKIFILMGLVKKIETYNSKNKYYFKRCLTDQEKYDQVKLWWTDYKFQLYMAFRNPDELNLFLQHSISDVTMDVLYRAQKKKVPFFVTPYYLSLLNTEENGFDDLTLRSYVLYSSELVETFGTIHAWEKEDDVEKNKPNIAGYLVPDGKNIHRRYPDVAIMIPDSIGRSCAGLCASCQRMYDFQNNHLTFDRDLLIPKLSWDDKLKELMTYFEEDTQLRDILITGGDALMSRNATLRTILTEVYRMAARKRKMNLLRPEGEKYAEIQRVRLGTRIPIYMPYRINSKLIAILEEFKEKAERIGITQFYIQTHYETPLEVTPESKTAVEMLQAAGWTVTNQLVFNVPASRRGHTAKLRRVLNSIGVICYYTFTVKGFKENYNVYAPIARSVQEAKEEKVIGTLSPEMREELHDLVKKEDLLGGPLKVFLRKHKLHFVATDRNVLNLPGIGKSMTFKTIGFTATGQRILNFEYDHTRWHSPVIEKRGKVYIVENKSIAAYLRQLDAMGENVNNYKSIWTYREGETEKRFDLFKYPPYAYQKTTEINHMKLKVH
ncbi:MAG: KamA family protein [Massilibacteroides sp.]|nr:KamA family protein [Massilibacteroides sp.]